MKWLPVQWQPAKAVEGLKPEAVSIYRMRSPFYSGERYAVRLRGRCLNKRGEWEREPQPSCRTAAFYARCRFASFEDAARTMSKHIGKAGMI